MNEEQFEQVLTLDVRPILKSGQDPFTVIMQTIGSVPENGALKLIAPFCPSPILQMLGSKGWANKTEQIEGGDWVIWLYKAKSEDIKQASKSEVEMAYLHKEHPELRERLSVKGDTWHLDVRGMKMPGPMELTLHVLNKLPANITLTQINERTPQFLFAILSQRGFTFESQNSPEGILTTIRKK